MFFISYTKPDLQWAEWIASKLEMHGARTTFQARDFRPGRNFVVEMHHAIEQATCTLAVLSPAYIDKSQFGRAEWTAVFSGEREASKPTLVPIRVARCKPTGILRPIIYIDLVGHDEDGASEALVSGLRLGRPVKGRTTVAFPGVGQRKAQFTRNLADSSPVAETPNSPPKLRARAAKKLSDEERLRAVKGRHLIDLDTLGLPQALALQFSDPATVSNFVDEAEILLRKVDPKIDRRAAVFGRESLPASASALRLWETILREAPVKSPRALAAILLRARGATTNRIAKLDSVLRVLESTPRL